MKKWGNAPPLLAPETFKADCVIYQHSPSDATGEFRRAGVNEASNDNLAVEEDCEKREQNRERRTREKYPCLCIVTLFPFPISIVSVVSLGSLFHFLGELERVIR